MKKKKRTLLCSRCDVPESVVRIADRRASLLLAGLHLVDYSLRDLVVGAYLQGLIDMGVAISKKYNIGMPYDDAGLGI